MSIRPLNRQESQNLDERARSELRLPTLVLMENAGRGAAAWLRDQGVGPDHRVLVLCGSGNNGGDGGVVARHLDAWGVDVSLVWFASTARLQGDAAVQYEVLFRAGFNQRERDPKNPGTPAERREWTRQLELALGQADWVVDALLGTGLTRAVEGELLEVIEMLNRSSTPVLSLDLPSGLDADSGQPLGAAVRARATTTFVTPKLGFSAPGASVYTGEVVVVDLGLPARWLQNFVRGRDIITLARSKWKPT